MRARLWLITTLLLAVVSAQPPSGLYLSLRDDFLGSMASDVALKTAAYVNSDTNIPAISGSNSAVTYTLSSFFMDIDLDLFNLTSSSPPTLSVSYESRHRFKPPLNQGDHSYPSPSYNSFEFVAQCNFHICAQAWPHPCDDGYIQIYTTAYVFISPLDD